MTVCLLLLFGALGYPMLAIFLERATYRSTLRKVARIVCKHEQTLVRLRFRTVRCDDHGNVLLDHWTAEIHNFLSQVLKSHLTAAQWRAIESRVDDVTDLIEKQVARSSSWEIEALEAAAYPVEYERFCAAEMRKAGWTTSIAEAVGVPGVDVIAKKEAVRLLLKCKWYARPIDSSVVGDINAARDQGRNELAAVVSNAGYTAGARQLAVANRVLLLHHADLREIDRRLSKTRAINTRREAS